MKYRDNETKLLFGKEPNKKLIIHNATKEDYSDIGRVELKAGWKVDWEKEAQKYEQMFIVIVILLLAIVIKAMINGGCIW